MLECFKTSCNSGRNTTAVDISTLEQFFLLKFSRFIVFGKRKMEYKIDYFKLIKEKLGMEQVLRHYRHTKDASGKWDCPFHPDVAPNDFSVTNDEIGYCWACKKWGDIYDVIQAKENCSKFEALKKAAEMAGVQIQFDNKSKEELEKLARLKEQQKRRIDVLTAAAEIYHQNLTNEKREKLKQERGWTDETINNFKIGFSVSGIKQRLISRGFSESDILGGLVSEKGYEYYQNRLMFPYIKNGKVVYVIGRETEETPKDDLMKGKYIKLKKDYLPNVIFNIDSLNKTQELFITEGVADCISINQSGFSCISPVTIRFKKEDFPELLKYAKNKDVFIANDNESSDEGMRGAVDTAKYLFENGISNVQIITIPKSENLDKIDMCDYLKDKENKNSTVKELINSHSNHILDFLIDNIKNKTDFNSINEVLDLMALNDSAILDPFLNSLKKKSGITTRSAIKKIRKIKEQLKKQQAEQQQKEVPEVQGDTEITKEYSDEKDVYLGIKKFNNPTKLYTPKDNVVYTHKIYGLKNDASYFDTDYDLYKAFVAVGNDPIFISSSKYDKIEAGETTVYLVPLEEKEVENILMDMAKARFLYEFAAMHLKISTKDTEPSELIEKIVLRHKKHTPPIFFKKTLAIPKEELKNIKDYYELIRKCVASGVEGDPNIDDFYISQIPEPNPERISPFAYMKTANHGLNITNSSVGKTTKGMIVTGEPVVSDFSSANLLGFATAEKKIRGKLDGRTRATILDEMQEIKDEEVLGRLLTYMAQGECQISKGLGVRCRGHSVLVFQGNPKSAGKDIDNRIVELFGFVRQFRDFLTKISTNTRALSKRIGEVNVGLNYKTITGEGVSETEFEKGQQIIRTIAESSKDGFTNLLKNPKVDKWITKSHSKEYCDRIDSIIKECEDYLTKEFLEGQKINYRGVRGGAIRRAWLKVGLSKFFNNRNLSDEDIDEILESAQDFFNTLLAKNLKSCATIVKSISSEEVYGPILEMNLQNLRPIYAKIMFFSLFEHKLNSSTEEKIIHISQLEESFKGIRENLDVGRKYEYFSRIKEPFEQQLGHLRFHLGEFGLDYDKSLNSFIIENTAKFSTILEVYKKWKVKQVQ
jgi:DNA primase catalytic core